MVIMEYLCINPINYPWDIAFDEMGHYLGPS